MPETKKTWTEPELIVITRGKPEEMVLIKCKETYPTPGAGPNSFDSCCNVYDTCGTIVCSSSGAS